MAENNLVFISDIPTSIKEGDVQQQLRELLDN